MKIFHILFALITLVGGPHAIGMPELYGGKKIEGRVEKIEKFSPSVRMTGAWSVVHLKDVTGIDRGQAKELLAVFRRSGYLAARKTLGKDEVVIVLPEAKAAKLRIDTRIRLVDYYALVLEESRTLNNVTVQEVNMVKE